MENASGDETRASAMTVRHAPASAPWATPLLPETTTCILVSAEEFSQFTTLVPDDIALFGVVRSDSESVQAIDRSGQLVRFRSAPMLCIGLFAMQKTSAAKLSATGQIFEGWSGIDFAPTVLLPDNRQREQFFLTLVQSLLRRAQGYAGHVARLSRELYRLRAVHEDALNSFAALEHFVSAAGIQPCHLTFENPPDVDRQLHSSAEGAVVQVLPVTTFGLSVIQIHIPALVDRDPLYGGLTCELRTVEDRELHQTWHFPVDTLKAGWLTLMLTGGLAGTQRTPELTIQTFAGFGSLVPLSLGGWQPLSEFRPRTLTRAGARSELHAHSLALRTWSGLPGVRPPSVGTDLEMLEIPDSASVLEVIVPFTYFKDARLVRGTWHPESDPVVYLPDFRGILCHPPPAGMTWAELDDFPVGSTIFRLSVRLAVRSPDSEPVEFAVIVATDNVGAIREQLHGSALFEKTDAASFSGWVTASYESPAILSLLVPKPRTRSGTVFFGTRMKDQKPNAFAWACFHDLRITLFKDQETPTNQPDLRENAAETSGGSTPSAAIDAEPIAPAILETVENAFESYISETSLVKYDADRHGIFCHPPASGVSLARLEGFKFAVPSRLMARLAVLNEKSAPVEFCMVISTLTVEDVKKRIVSGAKRGASKYFVNSGWRPVDYGNEVMLELQCPPFKAAASIYMATRMVSETDANDFAWAYFLDLQIAAQDLSAAGPEAHE